MRNLSLPVWAALVVLLITLIVLGLTLDLVVLNVIAVVGFGLLVAERVRTLP